MKKENDKINMDTVIEEAPFNLSELRLPQNFSDQAGVKKKLTTVPVRKPNRQEFIRVRADDDSHLRAAVLELKEERETYIVNPQLLPELQGEATPKDIFLAINRQRVTFLWPIKLPDPDGRLDHWNQSALEAASDAQSNWVRVAANMSLGAYEIYEASGNLPEPEWPDVPFDEIVEIAFRGKFIRSLNHPVVQRLNGAF